MLGRIRGIRAFTKHSLLCWRWPHHPIAQFQCYGRILSGRLTCPVDWTRSPPPTSRSLASVRFLPQTRTPPRVGAKCGRPHRGSNRALTTGTSVGFRRLYSLGHEGDWPYNWYAMTTQELSSLLSNVQIREFWACVICEVLWRRPSVVEASAKNIYHLTF